MLLSERSFSISLDLNSETTSNSMKNCIRETTLTQEETSSIIEHHQECSGEALEVCCHTNHQEVKLPSTDWRFSKEFHTHTITRREWLFQKHSRFLEWNNIETSAFLVILQTKMDGTRKNSSNPLKPRERQELLLSGMPRKRS